MVSGAPLRGRGWRHTEGVTVDPRDFLVPDLAPHECASALGTVKPVVLRERSDVEGSPLLIRERGDGYRGRGVCVRKEEEHISMIWCTLLGVRRNITRVRGVGKRQSAVERGEGNVRSGCVSEQ